MSFIAVRFVITGCSHSLYSGKQFQLAIPLKDENGPILVLSVLNHVRAEWPEEFPEMNEQVKTCPIRMLKTGELLAPTNPFTKYLSEKDLATAVNEESDIQKDGEKSNIIVHLVFQQAKAAPPAPPPPPPSAPSAPPARRERPPEKRNETRPPAPTNRRSSPGTPEVQRDRTDDRPQNGGGCCVVM